MGKQMALNSNPLSTSTRAGGAPMQGLISLDRNGLGHPAVTFDGPAKPSFTEKREVTVPPLPCSNCSERLFDSLGCLRLGQVLFSRTKVSDNPSAADFNIWESKKPRFWQPGWHQWRRYDRLALLVILWTIPVAQQVLWSLVGTISRELGVPPDLMATEY